MTLQEIDTQLDQIKGAIAQWQAQGYTPTIEKQIILRKMQEVYDSLSCSKAIPSEAPTCEKEELQDANGNRVQFDNNVIEDIYNRFEQIDNQQEQFYCRVEQIADAQTLIVKTIEAQVQDNDQVKNKIDELINEQSVEVEKTVKPQIESIIAEPAKENSFLSVQGGTIEKPQPLVLPDDEPQQLILPNEKPVALAPSGVVLILGQNISVAQKDDFIKELFCKDELFFANEIRKFQQIGSLDEALIYIGEKYNWAANNMYAGQFIGLLENYYK